MAKPSPPQKQPLSSDTCRDGSYRTEALCMYYIHFNPHPAAPQLYLRQVLGTIQVGRQTSWTCLDVTWSHYPEAVQSRAGGSGGQALV